MKPPHTILPGQVQDLSTFDADQTPPFAPPYRLSRTRPGGAFSQADALAWREIPEDECCTSCHGRGSRLYGSTSTWHGGMGGAAVTLDVCDTCWGSGNQVHPWTDLRKLRDGETARVALRAATFLADSVGASMDLTRPALRAIAAELDKLANGRKARPPFFYDLSKALAKALSRMTGDEPLKTLP